MNQQTAEDLSATKALQANNPFQTETIFLAISRFRALLRKYDIEVKAENASGIELWNKLSDSQRTQTEANFTKYLDLLLELHGGGISLRDNKAVFSHLLTRLGLGLSTFNIDLIENDHMVEAYSLDNVQIFRSINFFDYCNYTILELLSCEWFVLYERLESVTKIIFDQVKLCLEAEKPIRLNVPTHIMQERFSNPRGVFEIQHQACFPLFDQKQKLTAFAASLIVKELDVVDPKQKNLHFFGN